MGRCWREKPQGKEVSLQENSVDKNENEKFNYFFLYSTILFSNGFIIEVCGHGLKVSKFQNEFMKSSFLPKYEPNIWRISALYCVPHYRAEILTIFGSYFGRNDDFINSFWNLLTFIGAHFSLLLLLKLLLKSFLIYRYVRCLHSKEYGYVHKHSLQTF